MKEVETACPYMGGTITIYRLPEDGLVQGEISALHAASSKGHAGVVRILLRAGASIEATDRWGADLFDAQASLLRSLNPANLLLRPLTAILSTLS